MKRGLGVLGLPFVFFVFVVFFWGCQQGGYSGAAGSSGSGAGSGCEPHCHSGVGAIGGGSSGSGSGSGGGSGSSGPLTLPGCVALSATDGGPCPGGFVQLTGIAATVIPDTTPPISILPGVEISALNCPTPIAMSDIDGGFFVCVPANTPVTVQYTESEQVTTDLAEVNLTAGTSLSIGYWLSFAQFDLAVLSQIDPDAGAVVVGIESQSLGACANLDAGIPDYSGWTISASNVDGTTGSWDTGYIGGTTFIPGATATGQAGAALIYNISTNLAEIKVTATPPASLSSGCASKNQALGLTGNVWAIPQHFGYYPIFIP